MHAYRADQPKAGDQDADDGAGGIDRVKRAETQPDPVEIVDNEPAENRERCPHEDRRAHHQCKCAEETDRREQRRHTAGHVVQRWIERVQSIEREVRHTRRDGNPDLDSGVEAQPVRHSVGDAAEIPAADR